MDLFETRFRMDATKTWLIALLSLFFVSSVSAQSELVVENPSFEAVSLSSGGFSSNVPGWVVATNSGKGTFRPRGSSYNEDLPDGLNVAYIVNGPNSLVQTLTEPLEAGKLFVLEVEVGNRKDAGFADYVITIESGGEVLATGNNPLPPEGEFVTASAQYFVPMNMHGAPITIRLDSMAIDGNSQVNFDAVRVFKREVDLSLGGENSGTYVVDDLNDQGFFVTIGEIGGSQFMFVAWFTYDDMGQPFWLVGNGFFQDGVDNIELTMLAFSGLQFLDFSADRADQEVYGTMLFALEGCSLIRATYDFADRGAGELLLNKLTNIEGRDDCIDPFAVNR